jgi:hypothetical protein
MLCEPGLVFGGNEGDGSRFHVMRARTRFRRYRGHRVSFSCYAHPYSFLAVVRASGPFLMFYAPGLIFGGNEGDGSSFSCFACPDSFSAVPRAWGPVFRFCAHGLVFRGTEGVGSRFHVLRSRNNFRRYRGRRVPLSCFARPDSFSVVPRVSGPVFMFCEPGIVFGGNEGVGSHFVVLRAQTRFQR